MLNALVLSYWPTKYVSFTSIIGCSLQRCIADAESLPSKKTSLSVHAVEHLPSVSIYSLTEFDYVQF